MKCTKIAFIKSEWLKCPGTKQNMDLLKHRAKQKV